MNSPSINYSQCWEDPVILDEALAINSQDVVLSIMSGGDNTLALLLKSPQKIISIDSNPSQKYLFELKNAAIVALNHQELLEFLGVNRSFRRKELFEKVKINLSTEAIHWWNNHRALINRGVIHAGRFERFLNTFKNYILPLIHSKKTVHSFLNKGYLEEQRDFYRTTWDSKRWRLFFRMISSKFILKVFARQRGMFAHTKFNMVAQEYLERLDKNFNTIPLKDNYFMQYCFTSKYGQSLPPYLEESAGPILRENLSKLFIVVADLIDYLKSVPGDFFSKFNLSDMFEALSPEQNESLWREIIRTAKNEARIVYWNNLVPRTFPECFSVNVRDEVQLANQLHLRDRVFFYGDFHINTIRK